jgi:hypothetical protein
MMKTDDLILSLSRDARPVRRLPPPTRRALGWFALAVPVVAAITLFMGLRADLGLRMAEPAFVIQLIACGLTAFCAAVAGLALTIPGTSKFWALLPVPPMLVWLGGFGRQCVLEWLAPEAGELLNGPHLHCLPDIAVITAIPTAVMLLMLRRGACLEPRLSVMLGGLAAAALAHGGLSLAHPEDSGLLVLIFQFIAVGTLAQVVGSRLNTVPKFR